MIKEYPWQELIEEAGNNDRQSSELAQEIKDDIDALLGVLSNKEKNTIEMYYWEGMSQRDIAKIYGITQPAVSKRVQRGIKKMRICMNLYKEGKVMANSEFCHLGNDILIHTSTASCLSFCWLEKCPWKGKILEVV